VMGGGGTGNCCLVEEVCEDGVDDGFGAIDSTWL
jgi:hypothetical protein